MNDITRNGYTPKGMDGSMYVVLGGKNNTMIYPTSENNKNKSVVVKDFKYIQVKKTGKKINTSSIALQSKLYSWILDNIPNTDKTRDIW
ncbi:MAG: hypothetical protein HN454_04565 [Gammaproteobacteria bacterium]|jgi:hypothetical protein|nr:hypothetical protein [Gammaproteobacteria bacterium]